MKQIFQYLLIFFLSITVYILISPLRKAGLVEIAGLTSIALTTVVYAVVYLILTIAILNKFGNQLKIWLMVLLLLIGATHFELYIRLIRPEWISSFPEFVFRIVAILLGLLYYKLSNKYAQVAVIVILLGSALWMGYSGYDLWFKKVEIWNNSREKPTFVFINESGENVTLDELCDQYALLYILDLKDKDVKKELSEFQEIYEHFREEDKPVKLLAVFRKNKRDKRTTGEDAEALRREGYTLPFVFIDANDPALKVHTLKKKPLVLLLKKSGESIYGGWNLNRIEELIDTVLIGGKP